MKRALSVVIVGLFIFCMAGCANDKMPERPSDTTLEFWIAQDVSNVDFSEYSIATVTMFGGERYYAKGYAPEDEKHPEVRPDTYVIYTLTAYPDFSDAGRHVTEIEICDPAVSVYGFRTGDSMETFDDIFRNLGYTITTTSYAHTAKKGKFGFRYNTDGQLIVFAEVTNKNNIMF